MPIVTLPADRLLVAVDRKLRIEASSPVHRFAGICDEDGIVDVPTPLRKIKDAAGRFNRRYFRICTAQIGLHPPRVNGWYLYSLIAKIVLKNPALDVYRGLGRAIAVLVLLFTFGESRRLHRFGICIIERDNDERISPDASAVVIFGIVSISPSKHAISVNQERIQNTLPSPLSVPVISAVPAICTSGIDYTMDRIEALHHWVSWFALGEKFICRRTYNPRRSGKWSNAGTIWRSRQNAAELQTTLPLILGHAKQIP